MLQALAERVAYLLAKTPTDHLLDIGCGEGDLAEVLAAKGYEVTGIDPDQTVLPKDEVASGAHFVLGTAAMLPDLLNRPADAALVYNTCQYWEDEKMVIRELSGIAQVLKPGGCLFLGAIPRADQFETYQKTGALLQGGFQNIRNPGIPHSSKQLHSLLALAGFDLCTLPLLPKAPQLAYRYDVLAQKRVRNDAEPERSLAGMP